MYMARKKLFLKSQHHHYLGLLMDTGLAVISIIRLYVLISMENWNS